MKPATGAPWKRALRSLQLAGLIVASLVIYAYGFQVTKVNLEETRSPIRQGQLVRIIRLLAHPDIFEFDEAKVTVSAPVYMPCPPFEIQQREVDPTKPYILVRPGCVPSGGEIQVEGFNLTKDASVDVYLVPSPDLNLRLETVRSDSVGHFLLDTRMPERQSDNEQMISAVVTSTSGLPRFSRNAYDTWDKIVETVFLALLATTLGTALAIPLSFFAARNLMKGITSSMLGISLAVLAAPMGLVLGSTLASALSLWASSVSRTPLASIVGAVAATVLAWLAARWALPQTDLAPPTPLIRIARAFVLMGAGLAAIVGFTYSAEVLVDTGEALVGWIPGLPFLGAFVSDLGEIVEMLLTAGTALALAGVLAGLGGRLSRRLTARLQPEVLRLVEAIISAAAGAALFAILGSVVRWLYELTNLTATLYVPAAVGAVVGLSLSLLYGGRDKLPVGLAVYYIARTVFNGLRAVEALVMVLVFIVWVGIGPFAGVLALSLHSIAAMAKLYSEQVESILPGPLEAITATGATRMQTIIYAVVPQIIPPYISFTMYRWDINVRMSTIIGFAGGGGIGFLLLQNINLLRYREASAQMLAIAIVVAAMDYLSSALRERVV